MPKREKKHPEEELQQPEVALEEVAEPVAETVAAEAAPPSLEEQLAASREEVRQNWDQYLRARAELENFRKRAQRDREEAIRYANDNLLKEMIPVLDNLERALEHAAVAGGEGQTLVEGVAMTVNLFRKVLESAGIKAIVAVGAPFDPNLHQAMGQVESAEHPINTVVSEFQKGYLLNERLLRPALVLVAKAPAPDSADSQTSN